MPVPDGQPLDPKTQFRQLYDQEFHSVFRSIRAEHRCDQHGGRRGRNSTSEIYIRNMFDAWLGCMGAQDEPLRRTAAPAATLAEMRQ